MPDGDGYRSIMISRWVGDGKVAALYIQVHERRGILAAWGSGELTLEQYGTELEGFRVQDDLHKVPPAYVLDLVRDALYWSRELCYLPADFYMRRGIFSGHDMTPAHFAARLPSFEQYRVLSYREGEEITRDLFADPFFAGWFMASERVHRFAEEYRNGRDADDVLQRFCAELFQPELDLIKERLMVSADMLRRCCRPQRETARIVALAQSLSDGPLPLHQHPFLRAFALESMEIAKESMERGEDPPLRAAEEI